jgi:hypothetical protein
MNFNLHFCALLCQNISNSLTASQLKSYSIGSEVSVITCESFFVFLLAGAIAEFVAGYYWRIMLTGKSSGIGNVERTRISSKMSPRRLSGSQRLSLYAGRFLIALKLEWRGNNLVRHHSGEDQEAHERK